MYLSKLVNSYNNMSNSEQKPDKDFLQRLGRNHSAGAFENGKPPMTRTEAQRFISELIKKAAQKYRYKRLEFQRVNTCVELARRDVQGVVMRYTPEQPVTGYVSTLGNEVRWNNVPHL